MKGLHDDYQWIQRKILNICVRIFIHISIFYVCVRIFIHIDIKKEKHVVS